MALLTLHKSLARAASIARITTRSTVSIRTSTTVRSLISMNPVGLTEQEVIDTHVPWPTCDLLSKLHPQSQVAITEAWKELEKYPAMKFSLNPQYKDMGTMWFGASAFPEVSFEQLVLGLKFLQWAWLSDDIIDYQPNSETGDVLTIGRFRDMVAAGFETGAATHANIQIVVDVFQEIKSDPVPPKWIAQCFADSVLAWLNAEMDLAVYDKGIADHGRYPSLDEYLLSRCDSAGIASSVALALYFSGTRMTVGDYHHPLFKRLCKLLDIAFAYLNDLHSFKREFLIEGTLRNLVGLHMIHDGLTLSESYKHCYDKSIELAREWATVRDQIRATAGYYNPEIEKAMRHIEHIAGSYYNIIPMLMSGRYVTGHHNWKKPYVIKK